MIWKSKISGRQKGKRAKAYFRISDQIRIPNCEHVKVVFKSARAIRGITMKMVVDTDCTSTHLCHSHLRLIAMYRASTTDEDFLAQA